MALGLAPAAARTRLAPYLGESTALKPPAVDRISPAPTSRLERSPHSPPMVPSPQVPCAPPPCGETAEGVCGNSLDLVPRPGVLGAFRPGLFIAAAWAVPGM